MEYTSIHIQGNILSTETLDKIRTESIRFQGPESFGLSKQASIRDEIGMAWSVVRSHWVTYKKRIETLPKHDTGTSLTREKWILPLLTELGYELTYVARAIVVNDKQYTISHQAVNRGSFPVMVMGYNDDLDKRRESGGPRQSPHALVQEYLNHTEHLYALITNGRQLRLLRDSTRLVRLSYLEFDLEKIMEEELYADFALLFRTLHASRMPRQAGVGEESVVEVYHQESLASGTRIREKLSQAVEQSIKTLANGFLHQHQNQELNARFEQGQLSAADYYLHLLRLIYRILFIIVIEERKLIYPDKHDESISRLREIYFKYYSIERIRKLVERQAYVDEDKTDLWKGLVTTFSLFESERHGRKLGIDPLGSGLFSASALGVLPTLQLTNKDLLAVIRSLTTFENDQRQTVRVNYSDLDVEEFGSVYEGLLEYDPKVESSAGRRHFSFVAGDGRSSSGSHYTPEELVKPLIKHSLDYIIADRLKAPDPEQALLSIRVCDVACGSGHILLSAARRIATELACYREKAEQPSPPFFRAALREVIKTCIYGVDLNPLAVELCKVALWLEAHNPGEPLNFLDHHIKCGNAIVGLAHIDELRNGIASEAFKALPGDDKDAASELRKQNDKERKNRAGSAQFKQIMDRVVRDNLQPILSQLEALTALPEKTPEEIAAKAVGYQELLKTKTWWRLKQLADIQVAQFFISKDGVNQLITEGFYYQYLLGNQAIQSVAAANATGVAAEKQFFHWFLEFPEVMAGGGFDTILGNPPFLGGQKLTGTYGNNFCEYIKHEFAPIGLVDLVTYFFRRNYSLVKKNGFISLISTNTIAQGDARKDGLAQILKADGVINHAVRSMRWPGLAAVEVSLVTMHKGPWSGRLFLDQKEVDQITSYLDSHETLGDPFPLTANADKSFQGSIVLGKGFIFTPEEAHDLITKDPKNKDVLFPYLNGDDLTNQVDQSPSRWVINFFDWPERRLSPEEWSSLDNDEKNRINGRLMEEKFVSIAPSWFGGKVAVDYPDCYEIIERIVKPERQRWAQDKVGNDVVGVYALRKPLPENWWIYGEKRPGLYKAIAPLERVLCVALTSKYLLFSFEPSSFVFAHACGVISAESEQEFVLLQSAIHNEWARKYCSSLENRLRYTPSDGFENFPFPSATILSETKGSCYSIRGSILKKFEYGLTDLYNQLHNENLINQIQDLPNKDFQKKYGKETWNLYKHLEIDKAGQIGYVEAVEKIFELRRLHKEMDEAVLAAYGWHVDSEKWGAAIHLQHDFYEVDYLPENDRIRYTIHPEARKEVLKRLLLLNHERWEEEARQGLHDKATVEKFYAEKGKPIPADVAIHFQKGAKGKAKNEIANTPDKPIPKKSKPAPANQVSIYGTGEAVRTSREATIMSCVTLMKLSDHSELKFRIVANPLERTLVIGYDNRPLTDGLTLAVLNRRVGAKLEWDGQKYELTKIE